ncbi:MAG: GNAT family N-acetyltransferase [Verrucomicrobiae bacterium]|nr:GNAT family N-acetyltransferase [Verrucomicrobiae bacterium]
MMRRISQSEWLADREQFDRAVAATPEISRFCSSSIWTAAARTHLLGLGEEEAADDPDAASLRLPAAAIIDDTAIWRDGNEGADWFLFGRSPWGYWQPFESAWMFACPVIGPDPERSLAQLREIVNADPDLTPGFALGGVPVDGRLHVALRRQQETGNLHQYREFPATDSLCLDLKNGVDAWLGRRSRKFRRSLQAAERRCREAGLEIETIEEGQVADPTLFDRLLALQPRTAKWASGTDIFQVARYRSFYRQVFEELNRSGRLRLSFATRDGEDVAYIFGGIFAGEYRGLQMSYAEEVSALGVGNWLQMENLSRRAVEGVTTYDLGMDSDYKQRWADEKRSRLIAYVVP